MNCLTCAVLLCLHLDSVANDKRKVFAFCFGLALVGVVATNRFISIMKSRQSTSAQGQGQSKTTVDEEEEKQNLLEEGGSD